MAVSGNEGYSLDIEVLDDIERRLATYIEFYGDQLVVVMAMQDYAWFNFFKFASAADDAAEWIRAAVDSKALTLEIAGTEMAGKSGDPGGKV